MSKETSVSKQMNAAQKIALSVSREKAMKIIASVAIVLFSNAALSDSSPNIREINAGACRGQGATPVSNNGDVLGDGQLHVVAVHAPGGMRTFVGGNATTLRQQRDTDFVWRCMVNPPQPATDQNSQQRRCDGQAQDMSVEICTTTGGKSPTLSCTYVNAVGARTQTVQIMGCWR